MFAPLTTIMQVRHSLNQNLACTNILSIKNKSSTTPMKKYMKFCINENGHFDHKSNGLVTLPHNKVFGLAYKLYATI